MAPDVPKEIHNSLFRMLSIYVISLALDRATGWGSGQTTEAWKLDLLHDMVALMIYRRLATSGPIKRMSELNRELFETVCLVVVGYLVAGRPINYYVLAAFMVGTTVYNGVLRAPLKSALGDKFDTGTEDMARTLFMLSITDLTVHSVASKMIALFIHHRFLKL